MRGDPERVCASRNNTNTQLGRPWAPDRLKRPMGRNFYDVPKGRLYATASLPCIVTCCDCQQRRLRAHFSSLIAIMTRTVRFWGSVGIRTMCLVYDRSDPSAKKANEKKETLKWVM